jgi:hypothetical protein
MKVELALQHSAQNQLCDFCKRKPNRYKMYGARRKISTRLRASLICAAPNPSLRGRRSGWHFRLRWVAHQEKFRRSVRRLLRLVKPAQTDLFSPTRLVADPAAVRRLFSVVKATSAVPITAHF